MDFKLLKYCSINQQRVSINGESIYELSAEDTHEKSLSQTYRGLGMSYLKFFKMDKLSKLATLAAECLLKDTDLYAQDENRAVAVVLSNSSSSLETDASYQQTINEADNYFPSPSLFVYTLPNIAIGEICIKHKIYGENIFMVSRGFDAEQICFHIRYLFEHTEMQFCLAGWVECNEESYEAFLFLVEKAACESQLDSATINNLYKTK